MIIKSKFYDIARAYEKKYPKLRIAFWYNHETFTLNISIYNKYHQGTSYFEKIKSINFPVGHMSEYVFDTSIRDMINGLKADGIYVEEA